MNIFEEYIFRKKIDYPIACHTNSSAILILKADKSKWTSKWCVLSVVWENSRYHPGVYKINLSSPVPSFDTQNLLRLEKSHFLIEKSWFDYERFFYEWKPFEKGLQPVFGDEAFLCAWEIFICVYERWFLGQSVSFKNNLYETLNLNNSLEKRIISCKKLINSDMFSSLHNFWNNDFFLMLEKKYLNWFKLF